MVSSSSTSACIAGGMPLMAPPTRHSRRPSPAAARRLGRQQAGQHSRRQRREDGAPGLGELAVAPGRLHQGQPAPARASKGTPPAKPTWMRDRLRMSAVLHHCAALP
jgi:hypothetical protein